MPDVVQSVRQLLQDFIAPELRELKGDLKRLESNVSSNVKLLESKLDAGFTELRSLIENRNLRAELESTRDIADLRERVTRLESERGLNRQ